MAIPNRFRTQVIDECKETMISVNSSSSYTHLPVIRLSIRRSGSERIGQLLESLVTRNKEMKPNER